MSSWDRPQDVVEKALAASTADGQVAFVVESTEANLRWATNSLTTNGAMRSRQVVVVSFVDGGAGMAAGTVARTGTRTSRAGRGQRAGRARRRPGRGRRPAGRRERRRARGLGRRPAETSIEVFARLRAGARGRPSARPRPRRAAVRLRRARMTTTYLGTSTGLRLRHDQPSGRVELNGKSAT
jgi:predicted Zn-dependent protease